MAQPQLTAADSAPAPDPAPVRRLSPAARLWRVAALLAGVVLIARGTFIGNDRDWPFAPMSQFAFRVGNDDVVHETFVKARTPDGRFVLIPLSDGSVGMNRAEVEGLLPNFERNPAMLGSLAAARQRLHPGLPVMTEWYLCDRVTTITRGRPGAVHINVLVSWRPDGGAGTPLPGATPVTTFDRKIR